MNALIRCDASKTIGLGHLTRCLVLARKLQEHGVTVLFAMQESLGITKVKEMGFNVISSAIDIDYLIWIQAIIREHDISIFVGDVHDNIPLCVIRSLKASGVLTIAIDEPNSYAQECDLLFFPPHAMINRSVYKGEVYQGIEYVLLREDFYRIYCEIIKDPHHVLVMMGGTDALNITQKVVEQLLTLNKIDKLSVILNSSHPSYEYLSFLDQRITLYSRVEEMAPLMKQVSVGIVSFGTSAYELLAMQVYGIYICLNEEHWNDSVYFESQGVAKRYRVDQISNLNFNDVYFENVIDFKIADCEIISIIMERMKNGS